MKLKVNYHVLIWSIIIYLFAFQRALIGVSGAFSYCDELFAIILIMIIVVKCLRKLSVTRNEKQILFLLGFLCLTGMLGNLTSNIMTKPYPILLDFLSIIKVFISYYAISITNWDLYVYDELIKIMAKIGRVVTFIMALFLLISRVVSIGMTAEIRYGIKSFQFVFNNPGNFSKFFYFLIPLLVADLYYKSTQYKKLVILIALIVWISTMRSRAISFCAIFLIMCFFYFSVKGKKYGTMVKNKIKISYLIPVMLIAVALSWKQLVFYFTSDTQARAVLLRYGVITMLSYFPIGAGFGTFGSDVAATYYSELYRKYGFRYIYGMRPNETYFLNDNYWPMIMGQFGAIGTLLVLRILFMFIKMALDETKNNKFFYFATFCAMIFLLLSSTASKSYSEFSSICVFLLVGVFVKRSRKQGEL